MSVCDPKSPNACETCKAYDRIGAAIPDKLPPVDLPRLRELEDMETRLKALRLEARKLGKSGHPGVRAEGKRAEAKCNEDLAWVRSQLSKEEE